MSPSYNTRISSPALMQLSTIPQLLSLSFLLTAAVATAVTTMLTTDYILRLSRHSMTVKMMSLEHLRPYWSLA